MGKTDEFNFLKNNIRVLFIIKSLQYYNKNWKGNKIMNLKENKDTPLSILTNNKIDFNSVGGQWLLLWLEEKEITMRKFSPLEFYRNLNNNKNISNQDHGYKAMMAAVTDELKRSRANNDTPFKFINKYFD